ncbi:hypothetical protein [Streptomyces roseoverticillatus]|nr:hypothetical protein [Streptomyces roseoverticillatus]
MAAAKDSLERASYDDGQELIAGLDSLLSRMPEAPLDSFHGGSAR